MLFRLIVLSAFAWVVNAAAAAPAPVVVLPLTGAIGPAAADFVTRGLARAESDGAQLVVLQIDTPGGLDTAMRDIIKAILASRIPVAAFVAPSGARAASAGTYILYASHIAAMAPGTNLGAATPVQIGMPGPGSTPPSDKEKDKAKAGDDSHAQDPMTKKQVHDAAAYIRGFAQLRGRNGDWAERAVREAVSLSADEALAQKVIDVVAGDVPDLMAKLDGRRISTAAGERVLDTAHVIPTTVEPDWKSRFLAVITNPSVALILMMLGVYGLFFEFSSPGMVLPGVIGGICLLVGLFALQMLPINYAGLALILLGLTFLVAEAFLPAYGSLGVGGLIAFAIGAIMLIDTDVPGFGVPIALIAVLALVTALFVFFVSSVALKARRRPVVSGGEELIGSVGEVLDDSDAEAWARVHSEQWRVKSSVPLKRGQRVRVTARQDLTLTVVPVDDAKQGG
ncbi:MAG: nodulation protein NfeD [Betaproteobacteria bacterium]|nr:MAG: nodulation protein NfeD [Betaproteobacteria bacterium]